MYLLRDRVRERMLLLLHLFDKIFCCAINKIRGINVYHAVNIFSEKVLCNRYASAETKCIWNCFFSNHVITTVYRYVPFSVDLELL